MDFCFSIVNGSQAERVQKFSPHDWDKSGNPATLNVSLFALEFEAHSLVHLVFIIYQVNNTQATRSLGQGNSNGVTRNRTPWSMMMAALVWQATGKDFSPSL
ncbi:hypothetical protein FRC02_000607 [Tulasnella sp. 418]|nr:hypothetical protein FRC02_000607 [Tulasnella sp. 418]